MTNREWLESLDDKSLAFVLSRIDKAVGYYWHACQITKDGVEMWLSKEHEDEGFYDGLLTTREEKR